MPISEIDVSFDLMKQYADLVSEFGPDSNEAMAFRTQHSHDEGFCIAADAVDNIKRIVGGAGIDTELKMA